MKRTTTIEGYEVEIDLDPPDKPHPSYTHCDVTRGRFHASLACLLDTGVLSDSNSDREHRVPARLIGDIENWAYNNGHM